MMVTRRGLQLALASLWLLDAGLQLQPYMFTRGFAHDVVRPAGDGQPAPVAASVHFAASLIGSHPVLTNAVFAIVQLALAIGLFARRAARLTLLASIAWSAGVWWFGEGAGGLFSGHAMVLSGAPGAVLLYAVLAVAALPDHHGDGRGEPPRRVAVLGWVGVWLLGGILQVLPGQNTVGAVAGAVRDSAAGAPGALATPIGHVADTVSGHTLYLVLIVAVQFLVAVLAVPRGAVRVVSCAVGVVLALLFWFFGQAAGELLTGQATDPNSAPLLVVLALAAGSTRRWVPSATRSPRATSVGPAGLRTSVVAS